MKNISIEVALILGAFSPFLFAMGNIVALILGAFCPFFPQIGNVAALLDHLTPMVFASFLGAFAENWMQN